MNFKNFNKTWILVGSLLAVNYAIPHSNQFVNKEIHLAGFGSFFPSSLFSKKTEQNANAAEQEQRIEIGDSEQISSAVPQSEAKGHFDEVKERLRKSKEVMTNKINELTANLKMEQKRANELQDQLNAVVSKAKEDQSLFQQTNYGREYFQELTALLEKKVINLESNQKMLQEKLATKKNELDRLKDEYATMEFQTQEQIQELSTLLSDEKDNTLALQKIIDKTITGLDSQTSKNKDLSKSYNETKAELQTSLIKMSELSTLQTQTVIALNELKEQFAVSQRNNEEKSNRIASLAKDLTENKLLVLEIKSRVSAKEQELSDMEEFYVNKQTALCNEIETVLASLENERSKSEKLQNRLEKAFSALENKAKMNADMENEISHLRNNDSLLKQEIDGIRRELQETKISLKASKDTNIQIDATLQTAFKTIKKYARNALLVGKKLSDAQEQVTLLESNLQASNNRNTELTEKLTVLTSTVNDQRNTKEHLLQKLGESLTTQEQMRDKVELLTKQFNDHEMITNGLNNEIAELTNESLNARNELQSILTEMVALKDSLQNEQNETKTLRSCLEITRTDLMESLDKIDRLDQETKIAQDTIEKLKHEVAVRSEEKNLADEKVSYLAESLNLLKIENQNLESHLMESFTSRENLSSRIETLTSNFENLTTVNNSLEAQLQAKENEFRTMEAEYHQYARRSLDQIDKLSYTLKQENQVKIELENVRDQLFAEMQKIQEDHQRLTASHEESKSQLDLAYIQLNTRENDIQALASEMKLAIKEATDKKQELEGLLTTENEKYETLQNAYAEVVNTLNEKEVRHEELKNEIQNLIANVNKLQTELGHSRDVLATSEQMLRKEHEDHRQLKEAYAQNETAMMDLRSSYLSEKAAVERVEKRLETVFTSLENKCKSMAEIESNFAELMEKYESNTAQNQRLLNDNDLLTTHLENERQAKLHLENRLHTAFQSIEEKAKQTREIEIQLADSRENANSLEAELALLYDAQEKAHDQITAIRAFVSILEESANGLKQEIVGKDEKMQAMQDSYTSLQNNLESTLEQFKEKLSRESKNAATLRHSLDDTMAVLEAEKKQSLVRLNELENTLLQLGQANQILGEKETYLQNLKEDLKREVALSASKSIEIDELTQLMVNQQSKEGHLHEEVATLSKSLRDKSFSLDEMFQHLTETKLNASEVESLLSARLEELKREIEILTQSKMQSEEHVATLKDQLQEKQELAKRLEEDLEHTMTQLTAERERFMDLQISTTKNSLEIEEMSMMINQKDQEIYVLQHAYKGLFEENRDTQTQLEIQLATALDQLDAHKFHLTQSIAENDHLNTSLEVVQAQTEQLRTRLDDANMNMITMKNDYENRTTISVQALEDQLKKELFAKQEIIDKLAHAHHEYEKLEGLHSDTLFKLEAKRNELAALDESYHALQERLSKEIEEIHADLHHEQDRAESYQNELKLTDATLRKQKNAYICSLNDLESSKIQLCELQKDLDKAIAENNALNQTLNMTITENRNNQDTIQDLTGRLDEIENLRQQKEQIEARLAMAFNSLENKTKQTSDLETKINELQKEVLFQQSNYQELFGKHQNMNETHQRKHEQLEESLETALLENSTLKGRMMIMTFDADEMNKRIDELSTLKERMDFAFETELSKNTSLQEKLKTALADSRNNRKYAEQLELQMESLEAKSREQEDLLAQIRTQLEESWITNRNMTNHVKDQISTSKKTEQEALAKFEEMKKQVTDLENVLQNTNGQLKNKQSEWETLYSNFNDMQTTMNTQMKSLSDALEKEKERSQTLHERWLVSTQSINHNEEITKKLQSDLKFSQQTLAVMEEQVFKKEEKIRELSQNVLDVKTSMNEQVSHLTQLLNKEKAKAGDYQTALTKNSSSNTVQDPSKVMELQDSLTKAKKTIAKLENELGMKKEELDDLHSAYLSNQSAMAKQMKKMELDLRNQQNKTLQLEASLKQRIGSRVQDEDVAETQHSRSRQAGLKSHSW